MLADIFTLIAANSHEINKYNEVVHKSDFPYYLNIKLPDFIADGYKLYDIVNQSESNYTHIDFIGCVRHDRIWLTVNSAMLDMSQGFHKYKLSFVCPKYNDITVDLYISYTILDTTEPKSYKYMDEKRKEQ